MTRLHISKVPNNMLLFEHIKSIKLPKPELEEDKRHIKQDKRIIQDAEGLLFLIDAYMQACRKLAPMDQTNSWNL